MCVRPSWLQRWLQGALSICPSPSVSQLRPPPASVFQAKREWEGSAQKWLEGLAQCQQEAEARLREVRQCVDSLPRQVGEDQGTSPPPHWAAWAARPPRVCCR